MRLVKISIVRDDGYAKSVGFLPEDLIYKINGQYVETPQAVSDAIAKGAGIFTVVRGDKFIDISVQSSSLGVVLGEAVFDEDEWLKGRAVAGVLLSTAQAIPERKVVKTIGVVGAQCVYGVNALADLAAGVREFVGGRSQGLQKRIAEARVEVCRELQIEAHAVGGNAIIATSFEHTEIGDKGGYMLMVVGTGTAVVLE